MFFPLVKADAVNRLVYARAAVEEPDKTREIMDYSTAVPQFELWSNRFKEATLGKSLGNIRAMHNPQHLSGVVKQIEFNDDEKAIDVCFKVLDPVDWHKLEEGGYTGLSIGGGYLKKWKDDADPALTRYTPRISEISLVDSPCIPSARIMQLQKQDGSTEEVLLKGVLPPTFAQLLPPPTFGELFKKDAWQHIAAGAGGGLAGTGLGSALSSKKSSATGQALGGEVGSTAGEIVGSKIGSRFGLAGTAAGGFLGGLVGTYGGGLLGDRESTKVKKPRAVRRAALKQDPEGELEKITFPGRVGTVVGQIHRRVVPFLQGVKEGPVGQTFGHVQTGLGYVKTTKDIASIGGGAIGAVGGLSALSNRRKRKARQDQGVVKTPKLARAELIDKLTKIIVPAKTTGELQKVGLFQAAALGAAGYHAGGKVGAHIGRRIGEALAEHGSERVANAAHHGENIGRHVGRAVGAVSGVDAGMAIAATNAREMRRLERKMKRTGQSHAVWGKQEPAGDLEKVSLGSDEGREKIRQVMHEYKHGSLRSFRSNLPKKKMPHVTDRKQAIAIALNQARRMMGKQDVLSRAVDDLEKIGPYTIPRAIFAGSVLTGAAVGAGHRFRKAPRHSLLHHLGGLALTGGAPYIGYRIGRALTGFRPRKSDVDLANAANAGHAVAGPAGAAIAAVRQHKRQEHRIGKSEHVDFLTKFANPIKLLPAPG